jgi:hypothetical protein
MAIGEITQEGLQQLINYIKLAKDSLPEGDAAAANYGFTVVGLFTLYVEGGLSFGGAFFLGFLTSRLRASLFPMANSLPQVANHS